MQKVQIHWLSALVSAVVGMLPVSAAGKVMAMQRGDKVVVMQVLQAWVET
jgi:hypothetical protein